MDLLHHPWPGADRDPVLLVMLPGFGIEAGEFAAHGFHRLAQASGDPVDIIAAGPDLDAYLDGGVAAEIEREIVAPERARGRTRIWLLGLSLGGMGALLHARAHPAGVEGIILIAPFLGTPGLIAEVEAAGGLRAWQAGAITAADTERHMLAWLKRHISAPEPRPALYLGYALGDRFARGHAVLGARLPPGRVVREEGGHDWPTWTRVWQRLLDLRPFARDAA